MKTIKLTAALIALMGILLFSCEKDQDIQTVDNTVINEDAYAEKVFEEVSDIADEAYDSQSGGLKATGWNRIFLGVCATVTLDTTELPYVLTIDFGDVNCLCPDGHYRRGMIIISFTGRYRHPGTVITHTFQDYYVDDNKIEGTHVLTNMGENEDGHLWFTTEVVGVIHMANNGGTISWNASRVREWIQGSNTRNPWDDIYLLTGEASGIRANGETWEREIINPLRLELACRFIVSGTVEIRPEERPVRLLDYGNGDCDNIATVLVNGVTYTIYLRH